MQRRIEKLKNGFFNRGDNVLKKTNSIILAEYAIRFVLAFVLSGANIFGTLSPFAVGLTAAAGAGAAGIVTLLGACIGYLFNGGMFWALKYMGISFLVCATAYVFRDTEVYKRTWFMPAAAGLMAICTGFVYVADEGWKFAAVVLYFTETILIAGSAYFYRIALSPWSGRLNFENSAEIKHTVSVLIFLSTILISVSSITIFGIISMGRIAAAFLVLVAAYKGGAGLGSASGLSIGIAMDAAAGAVPFFSVAYGISGLISGVFSKHGRLLFAISFIVADAVALLSAWDSVGSTAILYEVFIASVIFMVIPNSFMSKAGAMLPAETSGYGILKARDYTKQRVEQTAQAFRDLYETVKTAAGADRNDSDIATVFDKAAEITCRKCALTAKCWHREYESTLSLLNDIAPQMLERGKLLKSDFPDYFSERCLNLSGFIDAVNDELRALLYRRQYRNRLRENQNAAFNQYADIAAVLKGMAAELGSEIKIEPLLEHKLHKYLRSQSIEANTAVFRDRGGRLHAEITSGSLNTLKKDEQYLDKLSAVLGSRLCAAEDNRKPDCLMLFEAEPLAVTVGVAALKKQERQSSGDQGKYFKTDEGVFYVLLSDGMGTGDGAARLSSDTVRILERFLRSGVAAKTSLRILNDLMLLKNENDTGCATVDLFSINLFNGEARMFKYGAAPSYIRHGKTVQSIKGKSLAAGLGAPPLDSPDYLKMRIEPGNFAVIVSDGVTGGLDDSWLRDLISQFEGISPNELARSILEAAAIKFGSEDDITVLTILVKERA